MPRPVGNGAGHGGPAKGAGWGGPAKGASTSRIKPGDPDGIQAMSNDPEVRARRARQADELHERLYALATDADRQETQLAATIAFLNRVEGTPNQKLDVNSTGTSDVVMRIITGVPRDDADDRDEG
jgi:hypothetical protein